MLTDFEMISNPESDEIHFVRTHEAPRMSPRPLKNTAEPAFLIDLDGTLVRGGAPTPGAVRLVKALAGRFVVVSNNSSHTPEALAGELRHIGLDIPASRLVLAGDVAMHFVLRDHPGARVLFCGNETMAEHAKRLGLKLACEDEWVDIVLISRDETFTYDKLRRAVNAVRRGALLIATNPDIGHPGLAGIIVPETGALLTSLMAFPGVRLHQTIGKPEPHLFLEGMRRLGESPSDLVMVGDNAATDGVGAASLGMRHILVDPDDPAFDLHDVVLADV